MIVVEDENSGERSPLKSGPTSPNLPSQPPPPPYAAAAAHHHSYHSVTPGLPLHRPPPVTVVVLQRETPLRRFLKAFGVALMILVLWSLFVDSLDMAVSGPHKKPKNLTGNQPDRPLGIPEWLIYDWHRMKPSISTPCSCSPSTSEPATDVVRALPIEYPPTVRPQVEMALPTLSTPCINAAPTPAPATVPLQS